MIGGAALETAGRLAAPFLGKVGGWLGWRGSNTTKWVDEAGNIKWPTNEGFAGTPN